MDKAILHALPQIASVPEKHNIQAGPPLPLQEYGEQWSLAIHQKRLVLFTNKMEKINLEKLGCEKFNFVSKSSN